MGIDIKCGTGILLILFVIFCKAKLNKKRPEIAKNILDKIDIMAKILPLEEVSI